MVKVDTSILIVGGGPVGLALAGDLGWRGQDCVLVEQSDGSIHQPRQDLVGIRTMEFCRRWGLVEAVEAAPYDRDYPQDNVYIAGELADGWEIGRYPVPSMNGSRPPPQSPQKRERCPQNMFDPILRGFAARHDAVDLRYGQKLVGFSVENDTVVATLQDTATGRESVIAARYLVGCDGAGSLVRDLIGTKMSGTPDLTYTTNMIFRCAGFESLHDKAPGYRFIFVGPEGTWATIVAINGRDEWRMSIIRSSADGRALRDEEIHAAILRAVGRDFDYELLSVMPWRRRELVADSFGTGPAFIAGDAAHAMSPTGGFGMNTGVGDAVDLSWKLDASLSGWGGGRLLSSYTEERRPVALRNVKEASGNLGRMLSPPPEPALLDHTEEAAGIRARVGRDLAQAMTREWQTLGMHLGYVYEGSPLCIPDGSPVPSLDPAVYEQTARPGSRAPHLGLADGRSTLDLFGRGFVLLHFGDKPADARALLDAAASRRVPVNLEHLSDVGAAESYAASWVLVRPDGHVAWRGDGLPDDCGALLDHVRGA